MNTPHTFTRAHLPSESFLGLTRKEVDGFLFGELIQAAATDDLPRLRRYRGYSDAVAASAGRQTTTGWSFFIPGDVLTRDLTAANAPGGGFLTSTDVSFGSGLYGASLLGSLPMRVQPMSANAALAVTSSVATQWLSTEGTQATQADPTFGQRAMTPKTVAAAVFIGRTLSIQTDTRFIEQELGAKLGEAVATALISGSGAAGEPTGLLTLAGTTSTAGASLAWAGVRSLISAAEGYTAGGLVFVAGVTAASLLRSREKATGSGMILADGKIDGIPLIVSRCAPADALILAPWPLVVMATWGALEVTITPLASPGAFQSGKIGVRLMWSVDFVPMHASVVGKATSIT